MRVIIAARLSKLQKNGKEGIGIETQDERTREWAERENHEVIAVVPDTVSGTKAPFDRENLGAWVTQPGRMAMYDGIIAYRNDRLSRGDWDDETRIRQWAQDHGKTLLIADGPQWPPRHDGDFWSWTAQAKQARQEWEDIQERSVRAQGKLREQGKLVGRPPFGYASVGEEYDHALVPTETGRIVVPAIFGWVIRGDSLGRIAERLDAMWVTPTSGKTWWARSIGTLIRNPTYVGRRQDASGRTIHECEPLVDALTFRLAGEALDRRPKRGPVDEANRALLSEILYCPRCENSPMYRVARVHRYRCAGRGSQRKGCGNLVPVEVTDGMVTDFMSDFRAPIVEPRLIPGDNHAAEIESVEALLLDLPRQGLSERAEDAERKKLRTERKRLRELPAVPDTMRFTDTGKTYAGLWGGLRGQEQGAFLRERGIRVFAIKGPIGPMLAARGIMPDQAAVVTRDGISVGIAWPFASDD